MESFASAEQILAPELARSETLLWAGRPRQGLLLRRNDLLLIPFSLMWGGFAIFWEYMVLKSHGPLMFKLWGIPFVCVGLYLIAGRFFADAMQRSKTYYGLTNERAIIVSGIYSLSVKSLQLRTLSDVSLSELSDGFGTITLGPTVAGWGWQAGGGWPTGRATVPAFEFIADARDVFDQMNQAQKAV
jgi:hypothetical protein